MSYFERLVEKHGRSTVWISMAIFALSVKHHALVWAFVLSGSWYLAESAQDFFCNAIAGWIGITLGIYFTLSRARADD